MKKLILGFLVVQFFVFTILDASQKQKRIVTIEKKDSKFFNKKQHWGVKKKRSNNKRKYARNPEKQDCVILTSTGIEFHRFKKDTNLHFNSNNTCAQSNAVTIQNLRIKKVDKSKKERYDAAFLGLNSTWVITEDNHEGIVCGDYFKQNLINPGDICKFLYQVIGKSNTYDTQAIDVTRTRLVLTHESIGLKQINIPKGSQVLTGAIITIERLKNNGLKAWVNNKNLGAFK